MILKFISLFWLLSSFFLPPKRIADGLNSEKLHALDIKIKVLLCWLFGKIVSNYSFHVARLQNGTL